MKLEELISKNYTKLNENDHHIWRIVSQNKIAYLDISIDELASICHVSRSTVMRFAQKLGLKGFAEFKTYLRLEVSHLPNPIDNLVELTCQNNIRTIEYLRGLNCDPICQELYNANRIFCYGTGIVRRNAASEFKRIFLHMDLIVENIQGESELLKTTKLMTENDVILIISKSGESLLLKEILMELRLRGISVISLILTANNTLSNFSNHKLFLQAERLNIGSNKIFESVSLMFTMVEILCAKYIDYCARTKGI